MFDKSRVRCLESPATEAPAGQESPAWASVATDWAQGVKRTVVGGMCKASHQTETYCHDHPGRIIATAACLGLAAGWYFGRARKKSG